MAFVACAALVGGAIVTARAATDGGATMCSLPGQIPCTFNADCAVYDATCDQRTSFCVCPAVDMAGRSSADSGAGGTGGSGGGFTGGGQGAQPIHGGGQDFPARSGCSYVPGSR